MKRPRFCWLPLALCALAPRPVQAVIGALDSVPAATLLLPYFEVDLDDPSGVTTVVAVANADAAPVIVHVTLWTDLSVPTLDFNMYLTGYDVVGIDLRNLFVFGTTPPTEHVNDADTVSPVGSFSLVTDALTGVGPGSTSCNGQLPLPALPAILLDHIRNAHRGFASAVFANLCSGRDFGDGVARGYITFDSVSFCTLDFPPDVGYFINGGLGQANNKNSLLGDYLMINPSIGQAQGDTLVHLEADASLTTSSYTFYRRYSGGADNREPLPTSYWARFSTVGAFNDTRLIVWRDSKRTISPFSCALTAPAPYPLAQNQIAVFDEDENAELPSLLPFPWAANSTKLDGPDFPVTPSFGWVYLNLNSAVAGSQVPFEPAMQNFVSIAKSGSAGGVFSLGLMAFPIDSALASANLSLPICDGAPDPPACGTLPIFADGFETGDTLAWSLQVP